uniref:Uncharacterized protein n=1 Tax=Anguilla anguilla TaxID=7936 RepID=A0A0E9XUW1_ANGAN
MLYIVFLIHFLFLFSELKKCHVTCIEQSGWSSKCLSPHKHHYC